MKLRTALTLTALAALMALPFGANAQGRFGHTDEKGGSQSQSQKGSGNQDRQHNNDSRGSKTNGRGNDNQGRNGSGNEGPVRGRVPQHTDTWDTGNRGGNDHWSNPKNNRGDDHWSNPKNNRGDGDQWRTQPTRSNRDRDGGFRDRDGDRNWSGGRDRDDYRFIRGDHDDWRDILYIGGFLADLDLLSGDDTVCFSGYSGELYPVYDYDRDCRSSDRELRARAELFGHTFFYRDGQRFERRTVTRHGDRYYQFVRVA